MGQVTRRKCVGVMIVPDKYWTTSLEDFEWVTKESNAKRT